MNRNKLVWSVITLLIAILCIISVVLSCKSFDLTLLLEDIRHAQKIYLIFAFLGMFGFVFFEGLAIRSIVNGILDITGSILSLKRKKNSLEGNGFIYAASDIYFSAITPSATGGQPASFYFLVKDGVPGSVATVVLLVNLVMYTLALMVIGTVCFILRPGYFLMLPMLARILIVVGYFVLAGMTIGFMLLLWRSHVLKWFAEQGMKLLARLHLLRHEERKRKKLARLIEEYRVCAEAIKGKQKTLMVGFVFNIFQRLSQISVTLFCFLAIGGSGQKLVDLFVIQGMTAVGSNSVPIPGAMGAVDYLLINGLETIKEVGSAANLELLSRGISFYTCTLFCGGVVLYAFINRKMKGTKA